MPHNFCKRSILRSAFSHPKVSKWTASNIRMYARFCCRQCAFIHRIFKSWSSKKNQEGRGGKFEQKCGVVYTTQKQDLIFGREIRLKYFLFCCTLSIKEELSHDPVLYNDIILELEAKWGKKILMTGDRRILHISFGATHPAIIYFVNNLWNMRDTGPHTDFLYRLYIDQSLSCLKNCSQNK